MRGGEGLLILAVASSFACGGRTAVLGASVEGDSGGRPGSSLGGSSSIAGRIDSAGQGGSGGVSEAACAFALTGDVLDPSRVYFLGTLGQGACHSYAIASVACPNVAATGFDCVFDTAQISSSGRLIYFDTLEGRLREFRCDQCAVTRYEPAVYPTDPRDNDPLLTEACPSEFGWLKFLVAPEGGTMHRCNTTFWQELGGSRHYETPPDDELVHLGYRNLALTQKRVVNLNTGDAAEIVGLPAVDLIVAVRARPVGSFWIALSPRNVGRSVELWEVDALGRATQLGSFPALPPKISFERDSQLEASGALFTIAAGPELLEGVIVRRTIAGESRVIYDEIDKPLVKMHGSALVTGP